jgi:flagellar protein FlgJ
MEITPPLLSLPSSPVDTSAANTYTDLNGLETLKRDPTSPQAIAAVAGQVEALFLQMMLKSMRDATASDDPDSNEMGMYEDMFDKQVALAVSQHDDLGIGRLLRRQIDPAKSAVKGATGAGSGSAAGHTASAGAAPLAHTPAEFVNRVLPTIRRAASSLGLNPLGLLAQAALETGWGQRLPRKPDGSSSLNIFGVKAGEEWGGARATADTVEFSSGVASLKRSAFRAYASVEDSVADFANLLKNSPRYREALAAGGDPQAYFKSIGGAGYATDPEYQNKLNSILKSDTFQSAIAPRTASL